MTDMVRERSLIPRNLPWAFVYLGILYARSLHAQTEDVAFLSEQDYFREIPQVFATSRLPQLPQDSSGANTVLDRAYIQSSGARNISELFIGVPGFQVGLSAGGRPVVAYHGFSGQVSQRMQVFVDGRSLYAPYLFGGVDWTSVTVPLHEIERIEIHRGSNSAAYGANAFLGVIHIYTRAAIQASGVALDIQQGQNGVSDKSVRWGSAKNGLQWRAVALQKQDQGLLGRADDSAANSLDVRADYQISSSKSLTLLSGASHGYYGIGNPGSVADPARKEQKQTAFAHLQYKQLVEDGQEWSVSASWTQDTGHDTYRIPLLSGDSLDMINNRKANRYTLEYQHYKAMKGALRASWGAAIHQDAVVAHELFSTTESQKNTAWRIYYNQEWRPLQNWTLNAGGLIEKDQFTPVQFAPRFSLNWKPVPDHVIKIGHSSAFRTPSLFEQRSDWRVRDENGDTLYIKYLSRGGLVPERIKATDLVYQGHLRPARLAVDARIFREELSRLITGELYPVQGGNGNAGVAYDLRNSESATHDGVEYQISWKPLSGSTLSWSDYTATTVSTKNALQKSTPRRSYGLVLTHKTNNGLSLYGAYARTRPMTWLGEATQAEQQTIFTASIQKTVRHEQAILRYSLTWRQPFGKLVEFRELQYLPQTLWLGLNIER